MAVLLIVFFNCGLWFSFIYVVLKYTNSITAHEDSVMIVTGWKATFFGGVSAVYFNSEVWLVV